MQKPKKVSTKAKAEPKPMPKREQEQEHEPKREQEHEPEEKVETITEVMAETPTKRVDPFEESDPFEEPTKENTMPDVIGDFSAALNHYLDDKCEQDAIKVLRRLHGSKTFYQTLT